MKTGEMVAEFHKKIGAPIQETTLDDPYLDSREAWLEEELGETQDALGDLDPVAFLDGLVDQVYILVGTAVSVFGPQVFDEAFRRVHVSNMTKDHSGRGKATKGSRFSPVDLEDLIEERLR